MYRCLVCALALSACVAPRTTDEYATAYDAANRLERENHPEEAARAYAKAAQIASRPRTKAQAAYRQARQYEKAGQTQAAEQLYLDIANEFPNGEMASRCLYYAGRIAFERDDLETGIERMRRVIEEYSEKGLAPQAVRRIVQQLEEHYDADRAIAFLREEEPRVRGTDVGDTILYRWAVLEREAGRWEQALEQYERLAELYPYPHSGLYDDAMWEAGQLAVEHGQPERALEYLEALVQWVEVSIPTGTYETIWTDDSQLLIGKIYLEHLNDPRQAAREFEELAGFADSTLADDGLWWASRAYLELGDQRQSCRTLRRLLEDFPYSNKQRQARQAHQDQNC